MSVMKKLNELQENSEWQFNEHRIKVNRQKKYSTKETESLKKNKTKILKLKNINEMKNVLEMEHIIQRRELASLKIEI